MCRMNENQVLSNACIAEVFYYKLRGLDHSLFFFFNDTATTEIYTLSLHDALPISRANKKTQPQMIPPMCMALSEYPTIAPARSEEHTSELQSQSNLVCRLLLEKKKKKTLSRRHDYGQYRRSDARYADTPAARRSPV